ncbi:MAG: DUF481 domain-containing protein [Opitutaceae bacterium]|nr:DUF481 domain-containing protein [Opitutaceae bacterium]
MKDGQIIIEDERLSKIGQFELISIAPDDKAKFGNWSAKVSFTTSLRSGNSEEKDFGINAVLQRRTTKRRFYLDYHSDYRKINGITTSDNSRLNTFFDTFFSKRIFLRPVSLESYRDPLQNISTRYTLGTSVGYHLLDNRKTTWDMTNGPAYQYTEFIDVPEGEENRSEDPAVVFSSHFDTKLTKRLDWKATSTVQYASSAGMTYHVLSTLEYELTKVIDLDFTILWDRIENPVRNEIGDLPGKDDFQMTVGIGIDL